MFWKKKRRIPPTGEEIDQRICRWIKVRYSERSDWQDPEFHCFSDAPREFRMVPALNVFEYNQCNGGWPQLLWNCFGSWRRLVTICAESYSLIGATEQVAAIAPLRAAMTAAESACQAAMLSADLEDDFSYFGKFTLQHTVLPVPDWQSSFWESDQLIRLRFDWLEKNFERFEPLFKT